MFFDHFPKFFIQMKKSVRALRYPLFCLLGYALRRLWNPKPQFKNEEVFLASCKKQKMRVTPFWTPAIQLSSSASKWKTNLHVIFNIRVLKRKTSQNHKKIINSKMYVSLIFEFKNFVTKLIDSFRNPENIYFYNGDALYFLKSSMATRKQIFLWILLLWRSNK